METRTFVVPASAGLSLAGWPTVSLLRSDHAPAGLDGDFVAEKISE
jgi:hypothetical protein